MFRKNIRNDLPLRSLRLCGKKFFGLLALGVILFSSRELNAVTADPDLQKLAAGLQRRQLDNGLICLIKEDRTAPLVSIQIWVGTGSAQEEEYLGGGLSHLIEHMIFKGTPRRKPADISKEINNAGGAINAYTSLDRTVFHADMPAEQWQTGLDVLADAVLNASFPEDEWRREKEVVRREMAMSNDDPVRVLSKLSWQTAYLVHPYRFPVIGQASIFDGLDRADLLKFFRRNYVPDNMIIAVVGSVNADAVLPEIEKKFGTARRARFPLVLPAEPPQLGSRLARKTGVYNVSRLEMAWHTVVLSHPDAPALDVLAIIAGAGKSSRLSQRIKEELRLAYDIDAWSFTPKEAGLFGISATFHPANETALIKAIENEVASWRGDSIRNPPRLPATPPKEGNFLPKADPPAAERKSGTKSSDPLLGGVREAGGGSEMRGNPFTAAEIESARNKVMADTLLAFQTMHGQADTFASGEFYAGAPDYFHIYLKRLLEVTPELLTAAASRYLMDEHRTLAIVSPPLTNNAAGEIRKSAGKIKVVKTVLNNGLTVLCREDKRLPFVHLCVASLGGLLMENEKNSGITCLMAELLTRGTEKRTQEQIALAIESRGGSLSAFSGMNSCGLQAYCFSRDADCFMDIVADCYLKPVFSDDEIEKCRAVQLSKIERQRESPMFLAQEAARRALFPGQAYSLNVEGSRESLMAIDRSQLLKMHSETAAGGNTVLAVFGDISPDKANEMAERFFGGTPPGVRQEREKVGREPPAPPDNDKNGGAGTHPPYLGRKIEIKAPREQTIVLFGFFGLPATDKRMDALNILLESLNGLSSDLLINVRDKKGLAYYTGAYHRAGLAAGQFVIYSGTRAKQIAQVEKLIKREIERVCGRGLRAEEFERARKQMISEQREKSQSDGQLAMECVLNELYGLGFSRGLETEKRIEQISAEDVRCVAEEIMRPEKMVAVTVKPEK